MGSGRERSQICTLYSPKLLSKVSSRYTEAEDSADGERAEVRLGNMLTEGRQLFVPSKSQTLALNPGTRESAPNEF